tara:strand:+ start:11 stop:172 length:162 start_codon:yes stop_codon:yes gene_type:complete
MIVVILFQKIIENKLKTPAQIFGEARECSYIYGVNEARSQAFIIKNKGYVEKN